MGQDARGEVYVLGNRTGRPFGTGGVVLKLTAAEGTSPPRAAATAGSDRGARWCGPRAPAMMAPEMGAIATAVPEVIFARQGMPRLADRLGELGARRVLVLSAPSRRFVDLVLEGLRRFQPEVFDGARVHVPQEVVAAAMAALGGVDTVVAVGGGSAIGLGKALRLGGAGASTGAGENASAEPGLRFAAIPTTYSGSEMTCIWGITRGAEKTTGRDPRVRPDVVLYDVTLSATLPIGLTVQSLLNALAHPIGALSVASLAGEDRALALRTAAALVGAIEGLLAAPGDLAAREAAMRAASDAGVAVDRGKGGAQHAAAHYLGGALGLDHAALHSVLLPQFIAHMGEGQPALVAELEGVIGRRGLAALVYDLLGRAGAPTSLGGLGVDPAVSARLMEARPELPGKMVRDAQIGSRPGGPASDGNRARKRQSHLHPSGPAAHGIRWWREDEPDGSIRRRRWPDAGSPGGAGDRGGAVLRPGAAGAAADRRGRRGSRGQLRGARRALAPAGQPARRARRGARRPGGVALGEPPRDPRALPGGRPPRRHRRLSELAARPAPSWPIACASSRRRPPWSRPSTPPPSRQPRRAAIRS